MQRIIAFLGSDTVTELVKVAKIQPTQRHKLLSWLRDHLDPTVPEQRTRLDNLDDMSTIALSALKAKVEGREGVGFTIKTATLSPSDVLMLELERHAQHRPELTEVLDVICKRASPFTALHMSRTTLNEEETQAVFDVLHGKPVEAIRDVLAEFVERHISTMDDGERIPPYKPIVFKDQRPARVVAALQSSVSSLAGARSFADCLDGVGLEIVPVLLRVPLACPALQVEPLPWG
ncbi:hypothetical protein [Pseudomonas mediterranea]